MTLTVVSSRKGNGQLFPESTLTLGPLNMGAALDGTVADLCAVPWALLWEKGRGVLLLQLQAGAWVEVVPGEAFPAPQAPTDRHVSLCFDQAGRHVFAWQHGDEFTVRQWNAAEGRYVYRGPFPGVDPTLFFDLLSHYYTPQSDVLVWFLSADRLRLCYRIQNENYATEHTAHTFTAPVWLDQAVRLPYQVQLFCTDAAGLQMVVMVGLYPVRTEDQGQATAQPPSAGELREVVIARAFLDPVAGAALPPDLGELREVVIAQAFLDPVAWAALPPAAGVLYSPFLAYSALDPVAGAALPPAAGLLFNAVIFHNPPPDALTVGAAAPTGGTLA
ncbi:hypothetical protein ACFFLM_21315 [Deinococcus oregonensis]|uniref:Uncharacterized protein n=1 Tax=Deinococcus oregonensis TaxID=1805970 RepID=A0ABV6B419_9DEIO